MSSRTDFTKLNKTELAAALRVDLKTITRWHSEGIPFVEHGSGTRANEYDLPEVVRWWIRRETKGGLDLEEERAKQAREQTENTRLKNEVLRGELIPLEDAIELAQRAAMAIRQKIVTSGLSEEDKATVLIDINSLGEADYRNFRKTEDEEEEAAPVKE